MHAALSSRAALGLAVAACVFAAGSLHAADISGVIVKRDGNAIRGPITWKASSKEYVVRVGQTSVSVPVRDVRSLAIPSPEGLQAAASAVQKGSYSGPHLSTLERIVNDYTMLQHDLTAGQWLALAYVNTGKARDARRICEKVMANRAKDELSLVLVNAYWTALVETGDDATLKRDLREAIQQGTPEIVALAHVKMGDVEMKAGRFKEALIDGYLRTIVLFGGVKDVQPEALYKSAKCFDQMGQATRAEKMRKRLLADYPDDAYSRKVQSEG